MTHIRQTVADLMGLALITIGIIFNAWTFGVSILLLKIIISCIDLLLIVSGAALFVCRERIAKEIALLFGTLVLLFFIGESYFRIFDPFPYIADWERNNTEYGNLLQYDPLLGWSGAPNGRAPFITSNSRTVIQSNRFGFRDIDHKDTENNPAIVFLGDSFTWGYELDWDEMFVNLLRKKLPHYTLFNLAVRGYGTDQEAIAFRKWRYGGAVKFVMVIFNDTDFLDNTQFIRYGKFKPQFVVKDGQLVVRRVPVPWSEDAWQAHGTSGTPRLSISEQIRRVLLSSQFIHQVYFWVTHLKAYDKKEEVASHDVRKENEENKITSQILQALNQYVAGMGARMVVVAIPSKTQFVGRGDGVPYQLRLEKICKELGTVDYLDLTPYFKKAIFRCYFREGFHLNKEGNKIIFLALYDYFKKCGVLSS